MSFLCRFGIHRWGMWRAGGITEHFDVDFPSKYPYKITRRYYRDCDLCGLGQMKRRKQ